MRRLLLIVYTLGLLMTLAPPYEAGATAGFRQQQRASRARGKSAEVAAIEAYCKGLDKYFKSTPQSTRYFVDALPEAVNAESQAELGKTWHEVKTEREMLEAEGSYANHSIVVSMKDGQIVYADIAEPREHHRYDHKYYFRHDGTLAKIGSEFYGNIAERHLTRENFYNPDGRLLRSTSSCFRLITTLSGKREKPVSCRQDTLSVEYGNYRIPVYKRNENLPGYEILKKR
ncbi:MAG TPA: hypothetical protein VF708_12490 [Pyrinomonadaceae bacterium]|jgi:hypothetical protein